MEMVKEREMSSLVLKEHTSTQAGTTLLPKNHLSIEVLFTMLQQINTLYEN